MKPPTLRFLVREWANFFFLVDNLAFPIDSQHQNYNREWLKHFGALTAKEKQALQRYQKLWNSLGERGGGKLIRRFGASFYQFPISDPKEGDVLKELLTEGQLLELNEIFEVFRNRFQSMWETYGEILTANHLLLEKEFSSVQRDFNQAFFAVGKLYGVGDFSKRVEVYLMMRPYPGFVGGRMLSRSPSPKIMVEGGVVDPQSSEQKNHLWLLLLHELTHACFEDDKFLRFLDKYLAKKQPLTHFLKKYPATKTSALATRRAMREMIINATVLNSFVRGKFDRGYTGSTEDGKALSKEFLDYFKKKSIKGTRKKRSAIMVRGPITYEYIAWKMEKVARPYLEEGRKTDERFLDSIYEILAGFPDSLLKDLKSIK